jgi:hypothetical protein
MGTEMKKPARGLWLEKSFEIEGFFLDFLVSYFVVTVGNTHIGYKNQNIGKKRKERQVYMP